MASRTRRTVWFLSSQYVLVLLNLVSGFLLLPLYLSRIEVATYGAWLATGEVLSWLSLLDPGVGTAMQQRIGTAYGRNDRDSVGSLAGAGQVISLVIGGVAACAGVAIAPHVARWLTLSHEVVTAGIVDAYLFALAGGVLQLLAYAPTGIAAGLQRPHALGGVSVLASVVSMVVTVGALFADCGVRSLGYGVLARGAMQAFGCQLVTQLAMRESGIRPRLAAAGFRELLGLSLYTTLPQLASLLATRVDSVLATRTLGPEAAAALALTRKGPSLLILVAERPSFAAMPVISEMKGAGELARIRNVTVRILTASLWTVGGGVAGFLALNGSFVSLWVGAQLYAGTGVSLLVCVTTGMRVLTQCVSDYCMALDNIKGNGAARLVEALLYVLVAVVGTRMYGLIGMAVADLVAVLAVSSWYFPRTWMRIIDLDRPTSAKLAKECATVVFAVCASALLVSRMSADTWRSFVLSGVSVVAAYTAALIAVSAAFRAALRGLPQALRRIRQS